MTVNVVHKHLIIALICRTLLVAVVSEQMLLFSLIDALCMDHGSKLFYFLLFVFYLCVNYSLAIMNIHLSQISMNEAIV